MAALDDLGEVGGGHVAAATEAFRAVADPD
jgi:hypothetical protein